MNLRKPKSFLTKLKSDKLNPKMILTKLKLSFIFNINVSFKTELTAVHCADMNGIKYKAERLKI